MKIFLAGATGAIGSRLTPMLVARGHYVAATTRTRAKMEGLRKAGAEPIFLDALDRQAVLNSMAYFRPDVAVHQLTSLTQLKNFRDFDGELAMTNRLRTEGTENLIAAAASVGAKRFVAQSFSGWPNGHTGGRLKSEEDPLDSDPPKRMRRSLEAIQHLERAVSNSPGMAGVVLRYGSFYGPGTSVAPGGEVVEAVHKRQLPIFGSGQGVWSWLHIDDAARATHLAIESGVSGIFNIVDDEPAEVRAWLPVLAEAIGAKPPRSLPAWLGRLIIGEAGLSLMTRIHGSSNAKAKRLLHWQPEYTTWRNGFRCGLAATPPVEARSAWSL